MIRRFMLAIDMTTAEIPSANMTDRVEVINSAQPNRTTAPERRTAGVRRFQAAAISMPIARDAMSCSTSAYVS